MLEVKNINTYYENIHALKDVSLEVNEGEIVALIGSNGAGKTTTLSTIIGIKKPKSGEIFFMGKNITQTSTHEIVKMGIGLSPEGRLVFPDLTVEENLRVGAYLRKGAEIDKGYEYVYSLFPRLYERKNQASGTLSGGEQQMLAIGRALMNRPKLLMLDEPSLGLAPNLVIMIFKLIKKIRDMGVTILLIEQNANMSLHIADRGYVLETGCVKLADTAANLRNNEAVKKAYLGG
ncbi:MAG TPA: ABC transporter ATP-binding protein [Ruminiclostridium sp.]|nr:ABC transporter ATP-binding protein [Ruminiclostridium sp.]